MRAHYLSIVVLAATVGGCLDSSGIVRVNADGSGTLEHRTLMATAAIAQVRQLGLFSGGNSASDPFSESQARALAPKLGEGVALMFSSPLKSDAAEGRTNVYTFPDITKLRFEQALPTPDDFSIGSGGPNRNSLGARSDAVTFRLAKNDAGNSVLTLRVPNLMLQSILQMARTGGAGVSDGRLMLLRQMVGGLHIALRVEPEGRLVRTSSPYVDGQTVTLFDMPFDDLLNNDAIMTRLQETQTVADVTDVLKDIPTFKVGMSQDVTIEFTPAR